ncbi:MAG: [Fe-Fe] hydrogenase large subunit C-terminal domain-containing protein, partial [Ignavibacteriaceae bacterium]
MNDGIVTTILDKCKRCYSCVRECPAKAIRVINGQATVLTERCIVCGHCIKVCSQNAKQILSDSEKVLNEILLTDKAIAIIAPSFAASFPDNYNKFPTALREAGFYKVIETAFGADLISEYYLKEFQTEKDKTIISSACPAVVNYIEKYYKDLVPNITNVVSPMIAIGRYLRETEGNDIKIVFIGPCIAKKDEYTDDMLNNEIDAVLTFNEIKNILNNKSIFIDELEESSFDPPHAYMGKAYPLAGGLLKSTNIPEDILEKEIIVVEGKKKVMEIIDEIANNNINAKFVDILFCEGCISGPAIDSSLNYYSRREKVIKYIEQKINSVDKQIWKSDLYNARNIDFRREFKSKDQRRPYPTEERIKEILAETNKFTSEDELNCGACGYNTCRENAVAIAKDLAEKDMCLPYLIDKIDKAYKELSSAQEQLQSAEKLASIGQLVAGIAHEINNPLGTILLYSSMLKNDMAEKKFDFQNIEDIKLIIDEATRCKNIVSDLLNFARQNKLKLSAVNIYELLDDVIRSVKINPRYKDITIQKDEELKRCIIDCDPDQLKQVFINLVNNSCEAMTESSRKLLNLVISENHNQVDIEIKDTGAGIPKENYSKIFTPFFTTKKIGMGTGLGLAISYGIIKMHKGDITFRSEVGKGTSFFVQLPKY